MLPAGGKMKAVILAGGLGTRLSEETDLKPKPMVEIGGKPILWHIMKNYSAYGINDFIICCGYKSYVVKEYFANYFLHNSDVTFDLKNNSVQTLNSSSENWKVTLLNTGELTQTAGRLKRISEHIKNEENFCFTYGDGVGNVNIQQLIQFHQQQKCLATVTAVQPPGRFGLLNLDTESSSGKVKDVVEKPVGDGHYINGGFFVLSPKVLEWIVDDQSNWEKDTLPQLAQRQQLVAFKHQGFWQSMDTMRDKMLLESLWNSGRAPWKNWT